MSTSTPNVVISSPSSPIHAPNPLISSAKQQNDLSAIPLDDLAHTNGDAVPNKLAQDGEHLQSSADRKGKGRAKPTDTVDELENYDLTEQAYEDEENNRVQEAFEYGETDADVRAQGAYPPVGDDELEERRITENLKRWEEAERLRRKAQRESIRTSTSSSLVGDVGRRASKLWKDGAQRRSSLRKGATRLRDDVSFDDPPSRRTSGTTAHGTDAVGNGNAYGEATSRSTTLSLQEREHDRSSPSSPTPLVSNNPFATPRGGSPSSFIDEHSSSKYYARSKSPEDMSVRGALMEETSNPPTPGIPTTTSDQDPEVGDRPVLQASTSYSGEAQRNRPKSQLPPPQQLDLPQEVKISKAPGRTSSPVVVERSRAEILEDEEREAREAREGRWWTDWLCGCREERRLNQDQAGATNPFE